MHLSLERHIDDVIHPDSIVKFDTIINMSINQGNVNDPDFVVLEDGSIQILRVGEYAVRFTITQMRGLSSDGNYFALMRMDNSTSNPTDPWIPLEKNVVEKLACDSNTVAFEVTAIDDANPYIIAVKNVSTTNVKLSHHDHIKASMMIFGIPPLSEEGSLKTNVETLSKEMDKYEREETYADLKPRLERLENMKIWQDGVLSNLETKLGEFVEEYTKYYEPKPYAPHPSEKIRGLTLCYVYAGYAYTFWGAGKISDHINPPARGEKLMLVTSTTCEPLQYYQGDPCICPCLCLLNDEENPVNKWIPIYFDNTGVYFIDPPADCLSIGVTFNYTTTLVLNVPK